MSCLLISSRQNASTHNITSHILPPSSYIYIYLFHVLRVTGVLRNSKQVEFLPRENERTIRFDSFILFLSIFLRSEIRWKVRRNLGPLALLYHREYRSPSKKEELSLSGSQSDPTDLSSLLASREIIVCVAWHRRHRLLWNKDKSMINQLLHLRMSTLRRHQQQQSRIQQRHNLQSILLLVDLLLLSNYHPPSLH